MTKHKIINYLIITLNYLTFVLIYKQIPARKGQKTTIKHKIPISRLKLSYLIKKTFGFEINLKGNYLIDGKVIKNILTIF
jgi:hypothetical protein